MNSQKVVAAKENISEDIGIVQERQNMIKLADSSDLGWKAVQEYESNPIADDSENEKRMNRALSKAKIKAKSEKAKRRPRTTPYNKERSAAEDNAGKYKSVRCYTCGKRGHWSDSCPYSNKLNINTFLSPFNSVIDLYQNQINTTESKINLFNTNIFKLSGHFNDSISHNKTVKVDQFVIDNTIEVHKSVITPVGSLKNRLNEWRLITDNQYILDILENGYKIPFKTEPEQIYINNNKSSLKNKDFVASEITNLLNKGCIKEVSTKRYSLIHLR